MSIVKGKPPKGQYPPIYVSDPNDPRIKSYQDSLYWHNMGEKDYKRFTNLYNKVKEEQKQGLTKTEMKLVNRWPSNAGFNPNYGHLNNYHNDSEWYSHINYENPNLSIESKKLIFTNPQTRDNKTWLERFWSSNTDNIHEKGYIGTDMYERFKKPEQPIFYKQPTYKKTVRPISQGITPIVQPQIQEPIQQPIIEEPKKIADTRPDAYFLGVHGRTIGYKTEEEMLSNKKAFEELGYRFAGQGNMYTATRHGEPSGGWQGNKLIVNGKEVSTKFEQGGIYKGKPKIGQPLTQEEYINLAPPFHSSLEQGRLNYINYLNSPQYKEVAKRTWGNDADYYIKKQINDVNNVPIKQLPYQGESMWNVAGIYDIDNNSIEIDGINKTSIGAIPHELSHLTDRYGDMLGYQHYNNIVKFDKRNPYYTEPSEIRARVNTMREYFNRNNIDYLNNSNMLDVFDKEEDWEKISTDPNYNKAWEAYKGLQERTKLKNEQIIDLIQNFALNNNDMKNNRMMATGGIYEGVPGEAPWKVMPVQKQFQPTNRPIAYPGQQTYFAEPTQQWYANMKDDKHLFPQRSLFMNGINVYNEPMYIYKLRQMFEQSGGDNGAYGRNSGTFKSDNIKDPAPRSQYQKSGCATGLCAFRKGGTYRMANGGTFGNYVGDAARLYGNFLGSMVGLNQAWQPEQYTTEFGKKADKWSDTAGRVAGLIGGTAATIATGGAAAPVVAASYGAGSAINSQIVDKGDEIERKKALRDAADFSTPPVMQPYNPMSSYGTGYGFARNGMVSGRTARVEVEDDELKLRKMENGGYSIVQDYDNAPSHEQGGKDISMRPGDIIIPNYYRNTVLAALQSGRQDIIDQVVSSLPQYTESDLMASNGLVRGCMRCGGRRKEMQGGGTWDETNKEQVSGFQQWYNTQPDITPISLGENNKYLGIYGPQTKNAWNLLGNQYLDERYNFNKVNVPSLPVSYKPESNLSPNELNLVNSTNFVEKPQPVNINYNNIISGKNSRESNFGNWWNSMEMGDKLITGAAAGTFLTNAIGLGASLLRKPDEMPAFVGPEAPERVPMVNLMTGLGARERRLRGQVDTALNTAYKTSQEQGMTSPGMMAMANASYGQLNAEANASIEQLRSNIEDMQTRYNIAIQQGNQSQANQYRMRLSELQNTYNQWTQQYLAQRNANIMAERQALLQGIEGAVTGLGQYYVGRGIS